MKRVILFVALVLTIAVLLPACGNNGGQEQYSKLGEMLKGEHELQKVFVNSRGEPDYFLSSTNSDGSTVNMASMAVAFSWKLNDGTLAIATVPLDKVRVQFSDTTRPTVKFRWRPSYQDLGMSKITSDYVKYVVFTISEYDWHLKAPSM